MFRAQRLALLSGVVGAALAVAYAANFNRLHDLHAPVARLIGPEIALAMGLGVAVRLASDAIGAMLQAHQRIAVDNYALAVAEVVWVSTAALRMHEGRGAIDAAWCFLLAAMVLLLIRWRLLMATPQPGPMSGPVDWRITWELLSFGVLVTLAQLADFLYAPMDFFLIGRLLSLADLANYAPAVQIDAALLLIVTGLAGVLLPKSAIAHAGGDRTTLRKYFVRGTVASIVMLASAALITWLAAPLIFRLWLGNRMPETQAILPLVLIHTVVGGSSAVGRSILLGMGKVKPFTIAVLIAGVSNVILSYCFVHFGGIGLNGIVLGTILAVVGRCAIWQPWYVWRSLNSPETRDPKPETRPS
jgi:O-antigen/teichoic acid export membrane protein